MDLSVISSWDEGGGSVLEYISIFSRPWQYRGEGNANIVIALQDNLRVLRLSKVKEEEWTGGDWSRQRRKVEREVTFANEIFVPLLGFEYVGLVQAVQIGTDQIRRLNQALRPLRPSYRLHKDLKVPFATAHADFARIHPYPSHRTDYCIEIKPKQGWWPKHLRKGIPSHMPKLCTYCLNQFLKLKRGKIVSRTAYCPLDLFSGVPQRIVRAILALISNPQNNLRIFRDGLLVYGENENESLDLLLEEWIQSDSDSGTENKETQHRPHSAISNLIFLLCMALLKPKRLPSGNPFGLDVNQSYEKLKSDITELLSHQQSILNSSSCNPSKTNENSQDIISCQDDSTQPLPQGSILSRILEIQKLADIGGGIERIYSIYKKICPRHTKPSARCPLPQMALEEECLKAKKGLERCCCESCSGDESGSELESIEEGDLGDLSGKSCDASSWEDEEEVTLRDDEINPNPQSECPSLNCLQVERWLDEVSELSVLSKEDLVSMEEYLLAATAKDCSIMITFSPIHGPNHDLSLLEAEADSISSLYSPTSPSIDSYKDSDLILQDLNGTFHRVRIGVADLDPKPVTCIVKHFLRDREMMEDYAEYQAINSS